jgi:glutamate-1-semialdehyde 2,1-aminomutase
VLFPYNDLDGSLAALDENREQLATVILEPFLNSAGCIPGNREYVRGIAAWCAANGVLLTFDEVASFRTSYGGAQSDFEISPDLVCLGKAIGGGFAIGAFGGRADVMSIFDPRAGKHIRHAGTFNGHPVTMAAGMAALELLDESTIALMNRRCSRLLEGIRRLGEQWDAPLTATGYGSIGNMHLTRMPPRNARDSLGLAQAPRTELFWRLIDRGFIVAPRLQFSNSVVTSDDQIDRLLQALDDILSTGLTSTGQQS